MTKDQEITKVYELIEKIWGSGFLMKFADMVKEYDSNSHSTNNSNSNTDNKTK